MRPLVTTAALLAVLATADVGFTLLTTAAIPAFSRDGGILLLGALLPVGVPAGLAALAAGVALRLRFGDRALRLLMLSLLLALTGLILRARIGLGEAALQHLALLFFLAGGVPLTSGRRTRLLVAHAALALALAVGVVAVRFGLVERPLAAAPVDPGSLRAPHSGKIVLIGFDGLDWATLERWRHASGNQDYQFLASRMVMAPLATLTPTRSPIIWTTIATGRTAAEHGVRGFVSWSARGVGRPLGELPRSTLSPVWGPLGETLGWLRRAPVSAREARCPPFWEILSTAGHPSDVIAWWPSSPVSPVAGRLVSDRFFFYRDQLKRGAEAKPSGATVYPPGLEERLAPLVKKPSDVTAEEMQRFVDVPRQELAEARERAFRLRDPLIELPLAYAMDETHLALAKRFLTSASPGTVSAFYFRGVDVVSHATLRYSNLYPEVKASPGERRRYGEVVSRYYAYTFANLRRLIDLAGEQAVILVVSDHGFERTPDGGFDHLSAPPGVLFTSDRSGRAGAASVYDITPTILWLAGYPRAVDMPGRPLVERFPSFRRSLPEPEPVASYGSRRAGTRLAEGDERGADERMLEVLRSLGYVE